MKEPSGETPKLKAQKLVIVDDGGNTRAAVGLLDDGSVGLALFDKQGRSLGALSVEDDGGVTLTLADKQGQSAVILALAADGSPSLVFVKRGEVVWRAP